MCEINPKFKKFYKLEFFSAHGDQETFNELLTERLVWMEQAFNASGGIRVHVHEMPPEQDQQNRIDELEQQIECMKESHRRFIDKLTHQIAKLKERFEDLVDPLER
jgi:hypothetical protein